MPFSPTVFPVLEPPGDLFFNPLKRGGGLLHRGLIAGELNTENMVIQLGYNHKLDLLFYIFWIPKKKL